MNRILRQEETGRSIHNIKQEDDEYKRGLIELQRMVNESPLDIKKEFDSERVTADERDKTLEEVEKQKTRKNHVYKGYNLEAIKPEIKRETTTNKLYREMSRSDDIKYNNNIFKPSK